MADRSELIVGGFFFGSFEDAEAANKELKNAQYLEERLGSMTRTQMKSVYDKMLDEKVFRTPVGWEYLKYLKNRLMDAGVPEEEIRPVPLYVNFAGQADDGPHIALERIRPSRRQARTLKDSLRISVAVNVLLVILVGVMFYITLKSDNPNILNYKEAIVNQYAAWEQELSEREKAVRERELKLEDSGY